MEQQPPSQPNQQDGSFDPNLPGQSSPLPGEDAAPGQENDSSTRANPGFPKLESRELDPAE